MHNNQSISFNTLRSLLFVPALNQKFVAAAHTRGADGVILDLEDSIIYERKAAARDALHTAAIAIRQYGLPILVRVNNVPELIESDLRSAVVSGADAIMIPKVDTPEVLQEAAELIAAWEQEAKRAPGSVKLIALLETPTGIFNVARIVQASDRLCGLAFGSEDFAASLGVEPGPDALEVPAQHVALAARAFDVAAWGLPGSIGDFKDAAAFVQLARKGKALGFTGVMGIHPKQIEMINVAFRPTSEEVVQAQRIFDAYEKGQKEGAGAVELDGKMIDAPIVERARRVLGR